MKNLEKLELKTYTYAELCVLFEEERKAGNSKRAQLGEWSRYFRWRNETSQKYVIEEIYDVPLERVDRRSSNGGNSTSKFLKLDDMVMEYLSEDDDVKGTLAQLLVSIGVLTDVYKESRFKYYGLVQNGIPSYVVSNILWNINSCVNSALRASLERLNKDKYIDMEIYLVLVLHGTGEKRLDKEMSNAVYEIENEVLKQLGKNRSDLFAEKVYREFKKKVYSMLLEKYNFDVKYYFREYHIKLTDKQYQKKSEESYAILTRKFVRTIGYAMLNIDIPKDKDIDFVGDGDDENYNSYGYTTTELIKDTMNLLNLFFVYMNDKSWDKYWDEGELDIDNNMKDAMFWVQYCLTKYADDCYENKQKIKYNEEYMKASALFKEQAIEELQDLNIEEFMEVIPEIDWKRVFEDKEYAIICGNACCIYNDIGKSYIYFKDKDIVKAYQKYCARSIYNGSDESELITFNEFRSKQ